MKFLKTFVFLFILGLLASSPAFPDPVRTEHVEVELMSGSDSIQPGSPFLLGVHFQIEPGWHVYWKNPGDSGIPTSIDWKLPEGFHAQELNWPFPERIETPPLVTFGYSDDLLLFSNVETPKDLAIGGGLEVSADVNWLVCKEICIPGHADLMLPLSVSKDAPMASVNGSLFTKTIPHLPGEMKKWGQTIHYTSDKLFLTLKSPSHFLVPLPAFDFFPDQTGIIDNATAQKAKKVKGGAEIELKLSPNAPKKINELTGVLVINAGILTGNAKKAFEVHARSSSAPAFTENTGPSSIWIAFLFSLLGGLILNLMPCVLPVLSIKILSFVKRANEENGKVWQHAVIFSFGVLATFWAFSFALNTLRLGGEHLGWGFQLQSPIFIVSLCILFFLMGLNLLGLFEVGTSLTGISVDTAERSNLLGSFASGVLATLVATPCTAPFMGSALGFTLAQPAWVSFVVFTGLGLGMALPYIILSLSPSLLLLIPKPGPWMKTMKQFMALLLFGTVAWLAWVLWIQTGKSGLVKLGIGLVFVFWSALIFGKWGAPFQKTSIRFTGRLIALLVIVIGIWFSVSNLQTQPRSLVSNEKDGIEWQAFSPDKIQALRKNGTPIFIDFTAAWCLSCQVNERIVFGSKEVKEKFASLGIAAFKADWTTRDQVVTKALQEFGRNGVPLYVIFGRDPKSAPVILPEIITPGIVLKELEKLKNNEGEKK